MRPRAQAGFSFIELIVGLAIITMLAAVVSPVLVKASDHARVDQAQTSLEALSAAIVSFEEDVKETAGQLSQLAGPITDAMRNVCGNRYSERPGKGGTHTWQGPYLDRHVPDAGLPVGIGTAQNDIHMDPLGGSHIVVTGVSMDDILELDRRVDGDGGWATGTVRWIPLPAGGSATLYWAVPSRRC